MVNETSETTEPTETAQGSTTAKAAGTDPAVGNSTEPTEPTEPSTITRPSRKALSRVVLLGIVGGLLAVIAAGREWAAGFGGQAPLSVVRITASGGDLSGAVSALGLAGIAGALALLATVRLGRQLVGALMLAAGVGLAVSAVRAFASSRVATVLAEKAVAKGGGSAVTGVTTSSWPLLAITAGVIIALAGLAALLRGRAWPGMSSRYEAPATHADKVREQAGTSKGLWDALDRGEDPTAGAS